MMPTLLSMFRIFIFIYCTTIIGQNTIHIPADYPTIQQGLNAAKENTQILVSPGTYYENLVWPKDIDGIQLIGVEGSRNTVIDGDKKGRVIFLKGYNFNITRATLIQGFTIQNGKLVEDNGGGMYSEFASPYLNDLNFIVNEVSGNICLGSGAYLKDFLGVITNCRFERNSIQAELKAYGSGLNITNLKHDPKYTFLLIKDCLFEKNVIGSNSSAYGSGFYLSIKPTDSTNGLSCTLTNCNFIENTIMADGVSYGTGLDIEFYEEFSSNSNLVIRNCTFEKNLSSSNDESIGGGLNILFLPNKNPMNNSKSLIVGCKFIENSIQTDIISSGAGLSIHSYNNRINNPLIIDSCFFLKNSTKGNGTSRGGGLVSGRSSLLLKNSQFIQNSSGLASGIYFDNTAVFDSSYIKIENCILTGNETNWQNGAALYFGVANSNISLNNVSISNNKSAALSLLSFASESNCEIIHCTFYNNDNSNTFNTCKVNSQNSIFWNKLTEDFNGFKSEFKLSNCIIKGGYPGLGNLNLNPMLVDDYLPVPKINSPCLSGGMLIPVINSDIDGFPRPMPKSSLPDLGAYEVDQYFAHVHAKYFYDQNQNGVHDVNEKDMSLGTVKDHLGNIHHNYSKNGTYIIFPQGKASLRYDENNNSNWIATGKKFFEFDVNSEQFTEKIEIGLYPKLVYSKLVTNVVGDNFRCGEEVKFVISVTNHGTLVESGTLLLNVDSRIDSIRFVDQPDQIISPHEYAWRFQNFHPGETVTKVFYVLAPRVNSVAELGQKFKFCHRLSGLSFRSDDCYIAELRCSFDPNDKLAQPQREDNLVLLDQPMIYTIRFQNTGNDFARNVIIRDTIDPSFNLGSLKILHTSHPDQLKVVYDDTREVQFQFNNIFLLDSTTNREASNGYVTYSIECNDNVVPKTTLKNTAGIYFDFNPAIVTNTTSNIVVKEFPTSATNSTKEEIEVYPNPTRGNIVFGKKLDKVSIYSSQGQLIDKFSHVSSIYIHAHSGMYILKLELDGQQYFQKVFKFANE